MALYKYDIPVGFPPGITSPREDSPEGDNPLAGKLFLVETPQGCHICFILPNKYKTQKGEKLQTPEILDKYSSSALLN